MKENTRKSLAIWMLGIGVGISILNRFINPGDLLLAFGVDIFEMSDEMRSMMFDLIGQCTILLVGGFWYGGILILKRLLNTVTSIFFNRLIIGVVLISVGLMIINAILFFAEVEMPLWVYVIFTMAKVIVVMSGAGVVRRNYILDSYLASKLRLFQSGVLLIFSGFVTTAFMWYFKNAGMEFSMLQPLMYVNWIVNIGGYICLFLGLKGIIQSDLLGENRKEDVFENVGGGWGERPVIGAVGYCAFLLIFTILAFQTVVTY